MCFELEKTCSLLIEVFICVESKWDGMILRNDLVGVGPRVLVIENDWEVGIVEMVLIWENYSMLDRALIFVPFWK